MHRLREPHRQVCRANCLTRTFVMGMKERVAYFNGEIVPESEVLVPFRDRSFKYGDGVFDAARTFGGRIFKLVEHIERLFDSLNYVGIDPGLSQKEITQLSEEVSQRNLPLLKPNSDHWVSQRISRGVNIPEEDIQDCSEPNVIIECTPLPLKARAPFYRDGIEVFFPSIRRTPPDCFSPNVKVHQYLNLILADLEVRSHSPGAWAILLDTRGFLAEGMGSNLFLVKEGVLLTPKAEYVLEGISRKTVIELAEKMDIEVVEHDLTPADAYRADEAFITSTSFCICPVRSFNTKLVPHDAITGPTTQRLTDAFAKFVKFDFVSQYMVHLKEG